MKTFQELKEYVGGFSLGSFPTMKPMVSLGDKSPNKPAGQQSLGVGINAAYSSQAPGTMRPTVSLTAQTNTVLKQYLPMGEQTELDKYFDNIEKEKTK